MFGLVSEPDLAHVRVIDQRGSGGEQLRWVESITHHGDIEITPNHEVESSTADDVHLPDLAEELVEVEVNANLPRLDLEVALLAHLLSRGFLGPRRVHC